MIWPSFLRNGAGEEPLFQSRPTVPVTVASRFQHQFFHLLHGDFGAYSPLCAVMEQADNFCGMCGLRADAHHVHAEIAQRVQVADSLSGIPMVGCRNYNAGWTTPQGGHLTSVALRAARQKQSALPVILRYTLTPQLHDAEKYSHTRTLHS